jgi:hypothetical protein
MKRAILASHDEIRSIRAHLASPPFDAMYATLRKRCAMILESSPVSEQQWRALWQQGNWGSATLAARTVQGRVVDLLVSHHMDPNVAYRDRAIEELKALVAWTTWADPCHAPAAIDLCTAECAVAAVLGLDWLWEDLTEADRLRLAHALRHRVIEPYLAAVNSKAWWYSATNHWNAVISAGAGLAALALYDELPQAHEAYAAARQGVMRCLEAMGREGGWEEGTGYWGLVMRFVLMMAEGSRRVLDDASLYQARGMDATGAFGVYFSPNGQSAGFGDNPTVPLWGTLYLLVRHYGSREVAWWLDTFAFHRDVTTTGWASAGPAMLFRPADVEARVLPDLHPVKVFNEIGWAAMADHWPRPNFYVSLKAGDLSASHSQRDMNSLQLQVDGEMLLVDLGNPPYCKSYLHEGRSGFYEVQARSHNTITLEDRDHAIDAQGNIIEAQCSAAYRWLAADAGSALGENVQFVRHAVMLLQPPGPRGTALVVVDEVQDVSRERLTLRWHTLGQVQLAGDTEGVIRGQASSLHFGMSATTKFTLSSATHECRPGVTESVIELSTPGGKTCIVSAFGRAGLKGRLEVKAAAGTLRVKVYGTTLTFKANKRHLQLAGVE